MGVHHKIVSLKQSAFETTDSDFAANQNYTITVKSAHVYLKVSGVVLYYSCYHLLLRHLQQIHIERHLLLSLMVSPSLIHVVVFQTARFLWLITITDSAQSTLT